MKMAMHLDKSQVPKLVKITNTGVGSFKRDVAIMAGYRFIDVMLVGGGGSRGGDAVYNGGNRSYGAGGGGGGSLLVHRELKDLPGPTVSYNVGNGGAPGTNVNGNDVQGNYGGFAGTTYFHDLIAYGGDRGEPGFIRIDKPGEPDEVRATNGGDGGGNSAGLGDAGFGGHVDDHFAPMHSNPTFLPEDGTWEVFAPTADVLKWGGGKGGGGGGGAVKYSGSLLESAQSSKWGAVVTYSAPGSLVANNQGGSGGGCNVYTLSAPLVYPSTQDYYGGSGMDGVIVYQLS